MPTLEEARKAREARQLERRQGRGAAIDTLLSSLGLSRDTADVAPGGADVAGQLALPAAAAAPIAPIAPDAIQPGQIAGAPAPIAPGQPAQLDAPSALGAVQPVVQPELVAPQAVPDFVGRVLAPRSEQVSAEATDVVQTLNGVQEPGIEGVAPIALPGIPGAVAEPTGEIPDVAAEKAPGALAKFGEFAQTISGELATNPVLQDLLGQVAQALTAKDPTGFPFQLATGIRESAQGAQQDIVRQSMLDTLAGRTPDERADPNRLTLSPELRKQGQIAGLNEFAAALAGQEILAGIETPEERTAELQLTTAQIQATQSLTNKRNLEMLEMLTDAGIVDQFTSTHLGLISAINRSANQNAALIAGTSGQAIGPGGQITYLFKNPEKARKLIEEETRTKIVALIEAGELPESAIILTKGGDKITTAPDTSGLDTTTQPPKSVSSDDRITPNSKFIGSKKEDGGAILWYYDTNNDGKIDFAVRTK